METPNLEPPSEAWEAWDFPGCPVLRLRSMQVRSLVRELRSHMLCGAVKRLRGGRIYIYIYIHTYTHMRSLRMAIGI